jgi:hypothetical protein
VFIRGLLDEQNGTSLPDTDSLRDAWLEHRSALADLPLHEYGFVQLAVLAVTRLPDAPSDETVGSLISTIERARPVLDSYAK